MRNGRGTLDGGMFVAIGTAYVPPPPPAVVRIAHPEDEEAVFDCLKALYADNGENMGTFSEARIRHQVRAGISEGPTFGGIIGVIDGERGRIDASVGIYPHQPWYSDTIYLQEYWLFVRPEARGPLRYERLLFDFASDYRRQIEEAMGQPIKLIIGVTSFKRLKAKLRLWSRHAKMIGGMFAVEG